MAKITREHIVQFSQMDSFSAKEASEIVGDCGADVVTRLKKRSEVASVEKVKRVFGSVRYRLKMK